MSSVSDGKSSTTNFVSRKNLIQFHCLPSQNNSSSRPAFAGQRKSVFEHLKIIAFIEGRLWRNILKAKVKFNSSH